MKLYFFNNGTRLTDIFVNISDEEQNLVLRRTKFSTVSLLETVLGRTVLADEYEKLKSKPGSNKYKIIAAKIEVKLSLEWEKAKYEIRKIEERSVKASADLQLKPIEADKDNYAKNKNIMSLIKKLKQKFTIITL